MPRADRFLNACRRQPVDATPVWLMRQAGRYMQAYRDLRAKYKILELIKAPELAAEVTLQPINAFDLDAAIVFADILPILEPMGLQLEFVKGDGPIIHNPVRCAADIENLQTPHAAEALQFTIEAVRLSVSELNGKVPLIGFSGAPFTVATYAIEGGASKNFLHVKGLMHESPQDWHALQEKLAAMIADYLCAQIEAGADAVQLFDSWIGILSPTDYRSFAMPHTQRVIDTVKAKHPDTPLILFGTGCAGLLSIFKTLGPDVIGVDWRLDLAETWDTLGDVAVQGNLDPIILTTNPDTVREHAGRILGSVSGRTGHIFNVGHGIVPQTPEENVALLVDFVHQHTSVSCPE
ncbi:MAG: uroporphyrinogen decarboxylase [Lentisphaeria bacterium]|nr:uroporphyrinogen decarboxylase [Lentisphaeria bacterium]